MPLWEALWGRFGDFFRYWGSWSTKNSLLESLQNPGRFCIDFGVAPEGLRRVLATAAARFSHVQPEPEKLDFGFHFGSVLRARSGVILTLGDAGLQSGVP